MSFQIHHRRPVSFFQQNMSRVKYNSSMVYALIGCDIIMGAVFFWRFPTMPPQIPLFFSHSQGEDQLGEWWMIFLLPVFLNVFIFINKLVFRAFFKGNVFVEKVFYYLDLFLIVTFTLIFLKIIFLIS